MDASRGWIRYDVRLLLAGSLLLAGCSSPPAPQPGIRTSDNARMLTYGVDARDYNEISAELSQSILTDALAARSDKPVIALGPIDEQACSYQFDPRTFQEKIQTSLLRSGKFGVSFAVDAMQDKDAAQSRYKVMQLQWEKENAVSREDLRTFGTLAKVDYLLFGRVSSQTQSKGNLTEVVYTYNWKLGNCESGLLEWADERERVKSGPQISAVFSSAWKSYPLVVVPFAFSLKSQQQYPALIAQWQQRGYGNTVWQTLEDLLYDVERFEIVTATPVQLKLLDQILGSGGAAGLPPVGKQALMQMPSKILIPNLHFFEYETEKFSMGRTIKEKRYQVDLFLRFFELDGPRLNTPVVGKGSAQGANLAEATNQAARQAIDKLLERVERKWQREIQSGKRKG